MIRTILHLDLDAFFCSVEERRDPTLTGRAFAVGGSPDGRGVVSSCSYAARRFGVRSAMPMGQARALCPHILCLSTNFSAYRDASAQVMARLRAVTPLVEQISIDEAFLDVSALDEPGAEIARRLQQQIKEELGLPCSLGIAANKLVAKIATDFGKAGVNTGASPQSLREVPPGTEADFLAPLPASALWGVGPRTAERLAELGITTIGDIAQWPQNDLHRRFGRHGEALARHAHGRDDRAIVTEREAKSVSRETTFPRDVRDEGLLRQELKQQAQEIATQLGREGLCGTTVRLKMRWPDFTTLTRQAGLGAATRDSAAIETIVARLFSLVWRPGLAVRLIGVGISGLAPPLQLDLWDTGPAEEAAKEARVRAALAAMEARFGPHTLQRGSELKPPK